MSPAMVIAMGCTAPAPSPWTARNAMSAGMDQANPQSTEPSAKSPMPSSTTGLRPMVSASLE